MWCKHEWTACLFSFPGCTWDSRICGTSVLQGLGCPLTSADSPTPSFFQGGRGWSILQGAWKACTLLCMAVLWLVKDFRLELSIPHLCVHAVLTTQPVDNRWVCSTIPSLSRLFSSINSFSCFWLMQASILNWIDNLTICSVSLSSNVFPQGHISAFPFVI